MLTLDPGTFVPPTPIHLMLGFIPISTRSPSEDLESPTSSICIPPSPFPAQPEQEEMLEVSSPFNRPSADIILRTSDKLDFRLQSQILLEASPVFETLLSLPQPSLDDGAVRDHNPPVIDIAESARVLDALMRICYPIVKPKARPFRDIEPILRAALKYEMELPIATLGDELIAHATRAPLQVWAIACRTGLEDVARRAAELTLSSQTLDIPGLEDLDGISAGHVFRLHEFHRLRGKVDFSFKLLTPPSVEVATPLPDDVATTNNAITDVPLPDLCIVSSDEVEFLVHRSVIAMSSSVLQAQVDDAVRNATDAAQQDSLDVAGSPKIQVDVPGAVLSTLLKLCYPGEVELASDPAHLVTVLSASERLYMDRVRRLVTNRWSTVAKASPLLAFLLATSAGFLDCAKEAANYALENACEGVYLREMEHAPGLPYHRLLMHYVSCRAIAKSLLSDVANDLRSHPNVPFVRRDVSARSDHGFRTPSPEEVYIPAPPTQYHGHGYNQRYSPVSGGGWCAPRSNPWLKKHLGRLSEELEQQPGRVVATTGELVEAACEAGQWCSSCRSLADDMCRIGKTLQEIPRKVKEVEFEL
ncbi:hypothetical protein L226DRAFT_510726 [Lentinus tigrinus ALCF2SS1-7]|uniref:BTB domain-containing protein n=1 Tax=Lentinus tigrinus ALCF2SS1-6 TaxID=1328759 RepID=A0A5C2S5T0_9APHY|nr:hypothetical protein L227DRAFT_528163 [Lentinus tigrinus ALCF2SS1-6]RPD73313.1 hypothetical protein L226DRAFT_510726 [Lentinus tigrinus ALCF2SS1-7]